MTPVPAEAAKNTKNAAVKTKNRHLAQISRVTAGRRAGCFFMKIFGSCDYGVTNNSYNEIINWDNGHSAE